MAAALPFIATAAAVKTAVDADKARKQATRFQGEQNRIAQENAAEMQRRMDEQTAAQQAAAETARQRLEAEQARYAEDKAKMEAEAKQRATDLETQRREMAERESGRIRARVRGGRRALLSDARLNPEVGVLGSTSSMGSMQ